MEPRGEQTGIPCVRQRHVTCRLDGDVDTFHARQGQLSRSNWVSKLVVGVSCPHLAIFKIARPSIHVIVNCNDSLAASWKLTHRGHVACPAHHCVGNALPYCHTGTMLQQSRLPDQQSHCLLAVPA